jgi:hypothetical protein
MSVRQAIVDALVTRLKGITTEAGFASDAGANVFEWLPTNLAIPLTPAIVVTDTDDTITLLERTQVQHALSIEVEGQVSYEPDISSTGVPVQDEHVISDIRDLLADIIEVVLGPSDRTLGGVCDTLQPSGGGTIRLEQRAEDVVAAVAVNFVATYRTDRGDWRTKI